MDFSEDEEDKDSKCVSSDAETVSFADWHQTRYERDQSKDDDMMNEFGDELEEEAGGRENQTKKKLNKQMIIHELKCPQTDCVLSFKSLEQLYQHQETVHGIKAYNCLVSGCSEQHNNRAVIGQHYSTVHPHHTNWTCPHCDSRRNNSTSLRNHIRYFHQFGRFGCWYDGCSFEADLRMKVQKHRNEAHPRFTCSINGCGKGFYYESILKHHQFYHSKLSENQVSMIEENDSNQSDSSEPNTSVKVDSKKRPKKKSHPKPAKRQKMDVDDEETNSKMIILGVECPQSDCDMMLKTMPELRQHQKSVHSVLKYPCLITGCSEQFDNSIKISHHYSTVHPHQNWVCSKCEIKFANPYRLRCHNRDFHQYGHFQCRYSDECTFEADLRSKVRNHYVRAHARYSCPIGGCDFVAYYKSKFKQHQQSLHANVREGTKRPKNRDDVDDETINKKIIILGLNCPQSECNLVLDSFRQLHQHQEDVHGVLQFPCLVTGCSVQYNNSSKIGHHYSTVHPRHTDWTCPQCNVKMKNATLLSRHIFDYHQFGQFHCAHLVCTFEADLRSKIRKHTKNVHI